MALAAVPSGCGSGSPAPTSPAQDYEVRGEVVRLPGAGDPAREIWLRHEAIPGFRDERGQAVGMGSMTMQFPLAEQVSVADLAVGDVVRFHLQVRWHDPTRPAAILSLEKLPAETRLDFAAPGN